MSLVTDANYKYYLGVSQSETITNNITPLISAAEKRVKEFLNRDLEWQVYTDELYDGSGCNRLILRQFPVICVTSIQEYGGIDSGNTEDWDTLVEHTNYNRLIIPTSAYEVILDGYNFLKSYQNYKVTYYAGYTTGATLTANGILAVGKKYQIVTRAILDFTTKGSSSNAVGTQFIATATGTLGTGDSVTELVALPDDIQLACKKLVALYWHESPQKNNSIGMTSINNTAGGAVGTLSIQEDAEEKILNKIIHHKAINV
jgi:hypothetical protein